MNKILTKELIPYKKSLLSIFILILLAVGLQALFPWPFKFLIDNVLEDTPADKAGISGIILSLFTTKQSLGFLVIFVFFSSKLLLSIVEYFSSIKIKDLVKNLIYSFSKTAFANLEVLSIDFYRKQEIGDYIYRLSYDVSAIGELIEQGILPLVGSGLYLIVASIILLLINAKLALLSLAALPFLTIGLYIINKKIVTASKKSEYWNSAVFSFIQEALEQLKIIQAYAQEKKELTTFNKTMHIGLQSEYKVAQFNFFLSLVIGIVIAISYSIIISYGITSVFAGDLTAGLLIVLIFYLDSLTAPLLSIVHAASVIKASNIKMSRIEDVLNKSVHTEDKGAIKKITNTTIVFKNVSLKAGRKQILNNVSFTIPENKITVIIGISGSGKTSTVSLIPRFIQPSSGEILIGSHKITDYSLKTLRDHIAYVPQEILLFNTSIHDILAFGKPNCTEEEIKKAAQLAIADDFIKKQPEGYNFKVGSEGNYLSEGERQRLMLARSYIKDSKIMILDEIFSSQDIKTRAEMLANLKKVAVGKTTIIVSNDLEVISEADYVIVVNNGRVIHSESHAELFRDNLLKQTGYYKLLLGE